MSQEILAAINAGRDGWVLANDVRFTRASRDEVEAEMSVTPAHLQSYGIVHGGVYCALVETLASVGAAIDAASRGMSVVGLENSTSFVRAARGGVLRGRAVPVHRGRSTQVWQVEVTDEQGRVSATGRVRLLCLDASVRVAGEAVPAPSSELATPEKKGAP